MIEKTVGLAGGVLLTKRAGGEVWSYPNIHGDITTTRTATGAAVASGKLNDPFGNPTNGYLDNSAGELDYGWLGQHQRPYEHQTGIRNVIEMGARIYDPTLGRFLETDPIEGGTSNDYTYVDDPINQYDLDGNKRCWVWQGGCRARGVTRWIRDRGVQVHRHATFSVSGCFVTCVSVDYQHGHMTMNHGGVGFVVTGPSVGWDVTAQPVSAAATVGSHGVLAVQRRVRLSRVSTACFRPVWM